MGKGEVGGPKDRPRLWSWWEERVLPAEQAGVRENPQDELRDRPLYHPEKDSGERARWDGPKS